VPTIEVCPACGDKFPYSRDKKRCKKCDLPIEVARKGDEAIAAWKEQTDENKRLFGRMHARQERSERKQQTRGSRRRRNKHGRAGVKQRAAR
jgi:hypothetical protein